MPPWATLVLAAVAAAAAGSELVGFARALGARVPTIFAAASAAAATIALAAPDYFPDRVPADAMTALILATTIGAGLLILGSTAPGPPVFAGAAALVLAPIYVGLPV